MNNKIGIIGGSFDPLHNAHLKLSRIVKDKFLLNKIFFLPSGNPPHKTTAPAHHRLNMLKLIVPEDEILLTEIESTQTSYTVNTLAKLKDEYRNSEFFYIIGSDVLLTLNLWKDYKKVASLTKFIVFPRLGDDISLIKNAISSLESEGFSFEILDYQLEGISSTEIRKKVDTYEDINELVPSKVKDYIIENGLYLQRHHLYESIFDDLKASLSPKRFIHSVGVAKMAKKLAYCYGVNPVNAEISGLLHDISKEEPKEIMYKMIDYYKINYDKSFDSLPNLAHGEVGAQYAKHLYAIDDEVVSGIAYHTYGHKDMSLFDKIIFISDLIEENRDEQLRQRYTELAFNDIEEAVVKYMQENNARLRSKGLPIHQNTIDYLNKRGVYETN